MADPASLAPPLARHRIRANGIVQQVLTAGDPDAPPVVLLHGLGWDAGRLWPPQLARLAAGGWYGVAPDLRGMGGTDKPDAPYSIDLYAADVAALMPALGLDRAAVVGFSLGGMIAMRLAEAHPDRVTAAVFACCGAASSPEGEAGVEAMLARAAELGPRRFAEEQADAIWHPGWAAGHPDAVADFVGWRAAMDQAALFRAFRSPFGVDLGPALPSIAVPARVIAADADAFLPVSTAAAIAEALPDADLQVIEGAGHMCSIEKPAAFDAALFDFLDRAWPGAVSRAEEAMS
ncbi:MAG: alpha/beta fold hydrolase [Alphaproteobacteria bacterium]|jgi:pimeloyl-ACP methyl ester carboxylesterase|nr:alpha/beta fold hydrolase [Alphaproteobacteria bacterium]